MKISFKHISYFFLFILGLNMTLTSCTGDLDVTPRDKNEFLSETFFQDPASYKQVLAKLYAGLYVGGNDGDGKPDIAGLGGDFSSYLRLLFVTQEFPTDEAIIGWADGTLPTLNTQNWSPANEFLAGTYSRAFYEISVANEFLRQTTEEKLNSRGVDASLKADITTFRAEARFLRAFSYYNLMDLFGGVPITTEADPVGLFYPVQKTRAEVFAFIEAELKDMDKTLAASKTNEYGRIDKTAAKFLLAQIYLNSKVYTGVDKNNEAATLCSEIITSSGYTFADVPYNFLFSADNERNGAQSEFIFPIISDGNAIRPAGGGMSFIIHASIGGSMDSAAQGMNGGWEGIRARKEFIAEFGAPTGSFDFYQTKSKNLVNHTGILVNKDGLAFDSSDKNEKQTGYNSNNTYLLNLLNGKITLNGVEVAAPIAFVNAPVSLGKQQLWKDSRLYAYTPGQALDIANVSSFKDGYAITKFTNVNSDGSEAQRTDIPDTDFPMFRLTDAYLMYAEATVRGASAGNLGTAVTYVNQIRKRANATPITSGDLTLDFILAERGRELYWECHRRTDLIRFGKFTGGSKIWQWKGGTMNGTSTESFRDLMPIPARTIQANPTLKQNPGY